MGGVSETSLARDELAKWCVGCGLDIGFGGDPILTTSICLDRPPGAEDRADCGDHPTHLTNDARDLPFKDASLDYVYSSHTLEDFKDTRAVLNEWCRVLKVGGTLVLNLPDELAYRAFCVETNRECNGAHIHLDFSLMFVINLLTRLDYEMKPLHVQYPVDSSPYSFHIVAQRA